MLDIQVLGSPRYRRSGELVTNLRSAKGQAIVCYLALTGRPLSRAALAGLLWPDKREQEARANLRQAIRAVQKALPGVLQAQRESVALAPDLPLTIDVRRFEAALAAGDMEDLETAAALYQGEFMAGFYVEDAHPFEEWLLLTRERLHNQAVQALHDLTSHFTAQRDSEKGLAHARRLLQLAPWLEAGHRTLMRLLARQEQYSAALKQYAACRQTLAAELGVEPMPETTALFERVQQLRSVGRPALPQPALPLFGRATELARLHQLLHAPNSRLVTLTGPGGIGKTRLMLAVAQQQTSHFLDGVYWVDAAEATAEDELIAAVMTRCGLGMDTSLPPATQLITHLRDKELLLLFDNFEQLAGDSGCLALIATLLQTAPDVVLLVTSQARLNLQAERVYRLDNLSYPTAATPHEELADSPAVQLFAATARFGRPDWSLAGNEAAVVRICQLTGGLPLALKMAASQTQDQSCAAVAAAIAHNIDVLASELADLPARQRSLRAAFDHALRLLSMPERGLFLRLSLFRGSFSRAALQAVVPAAGAALNPRALTRLVNHSLLSYQRGDRYAIHPVVRQFAAEQRREGRDDAELMGRYAAYYLRFLAERQTALQSETAQAAMAELDDEMDNVRQAWRRGLAQQQFDLVLDGLHALSAYCQLRSRAREAESLFHLAAQRAAPFAYENLAAARLLAWARLERARFLMRLADYGQAVAMVETAVSWAEQSHDPEADAMAHVLWGEALWRQGEYGKAETKLTHALTVADRNAFAPIAGWCHHHFGVICDRQAKYGQAIEHLTRACGAWDALQHPQALSVSLNSMGLVVYHQGDLARAQQIMEDALAICRRLGNRHLEATLRNNLSMVATDRGDYPGARAYLQRALQIARASGNVALQGNIYTNLGLNEQRAQALDPAVNHLEAGLQRFETIGDRALAAQSRYFLAEARKAQGARDLAETLYEQSLAGAREVGARFFECQSLIGLALLLRDSDGARAGQAATAAIALANCIQHPTLMERTRELSDLC